MASMILQPTNDGFKLLKEDLKNALSEVELEDENRNVFYRAEIIASFYDSAGVLNAQYSIPYDIDLKHTMHYLRVSSKDDKTIAYGATPPIDYVFGVGGMHTLKFPIRGNSGDVVFKKEDYLTRQEAIETLLMPMHLQTLELYYKIIEDKLEQSKWKDEQQKQIKTLKEFATSIKEEMQKQKENILQSVMAEILENRYQITELKLK